MLFSMQEEVWQGRSIVGETSRDEFPMEDCSSSSLVVFSKCLGIPTEAYETEIFSP